MKSGMNGPLPAQRYEVQLAYLQGRVEFVRTALAVPGVACSTPGFAGYDHKQQLIRELHTLLSITESVKYARDNPHPAEP